jgi:hypothetical protein
MDMHSSMYIMCIVCSQPIVQRFLMPVAIIIVHMHAIMACLRGVELQFHAFPSENKYKFPTQSSTTLISQV